MSVQEIESAINELSPRELAELVSWLEEYHARTWDEQIERDLEAGRLDAAIEEAERQYRQGKARPL